MVLYSLRTLACVPGLHAIVLVVASDQLARAKDLLAQSGPWSVPIELCAGGAARQDSVAAGLMRVDAAAEFVIVHDAARPFVSLACIQACLEAAAASGAAIAAMPARDTIKLVGANGAVEQTLDRTAIWLAQTPQVFRTTLLRQAYELTSRDADVATDDAALVERLGATVRVVPGEWANQKITTPQDLEWAEWYVRSQSSAAE